MKQEDYEKEKERKRKGMSFIGKLAFFKGDGVMNEETKVEQDENGGQQEKQETKKNKAASIIGEILLYVALFIVCLVIIPKYVFCKYTVDGHSMDNTLYDGQQLIGEKVSYHFSKPDRFDIVVIQPYEEEKDNYYVKRIIGLPGETVEVKDNTILINGEAIKDTHKLEEMDIQHVGPITLGNDEYFVMGDNRNISDDSRDPEIGPIPEERIVAHIVVRVWPFNKMRTFS